MTHNCQGDQADSLEQSNQPSLCVTGCGFFANPACNNMCSKCYRDSQMATERKVSNSKAAVAALTDVPQLHEIKDAFVAEKVVGSPQTVEPVAQQRIDCPLNTAKVEEPGPVSQPVIPEPARPSTTPERSLQKNTGRCFVCNKKLGLTGFKCRCEYVFCAGHRLAEAHDCTFDYKQLGRQRLAENNPLVQGAKMDKL